MRGNRILVVNADEFGRSPGINEGVIEAHARGVVTSASAMVRRPAAEAAAELARTHPGLSVGLHIDLGEWAVREGEWVAVEDIVPPDDPEAVEREILRQLETFRKLYGRDPTHLDSHQNVHRTGPALSVMARMARTLAVPLRHFAPGIFVCSEFHGQTSRGLPYHQGISLQRFLAILDALPPGVNELICHPGRAGPGGGMYQAEREMELGVLVDPRARERIREGGVSLRSFRELGESGLPAGGDPREMEASFRDRGRAAFKRGEFEGARRWFERAVAVGGDRPWPWLWLARAQLQIGDHRGSRQSIREALSQVPGWPPGLIHLADIHMAERRWDEAAELLAAIARRNGDGGTDAVRGVAQRIRRCEDPARFLRVAEILAEHHPDESSALAAVAIARWRAGDREGARRAVRPQEVGSTGTAIRAAAEFHLEVGGAREAWKLLKRSREGGGDSARLAVRAAQGLRKQGHLTLAWEAFEEAWAQGARDRSTRHWRDVVVGEIQVLSGVVAPALPPLPHYRPVPGRVLHLVGRSLPHSQTGYSVRTRYVTEAQGAAGLEPHVVTQIGFPWADGVEEAPLWESVAGIPHHRLTASGALPSRLDERLDLNARALLDLVKRLRPAALHAASDYRNALLALALGRACGIPVVYEARGFWEETWKSKQERHGAEETVAYRWRREMELDCMRRADRVVTLADVMRGELADRGIPEGKVHVVPNAVDPGAFEPVARDRELADRLGLGPDEVVVGYVSSLVAYEGVRFLIEAVARLAARGLPVRGLLVGDGDERPALEEHARELGVEGRVLFTGRVPHQDVRAYYGLIDVFVVPRTGDRVCRLVTPLKPYEAMAMARAVVVSGVEALEEMVVPGETGLVFRPEDAEDLVRVLEPLVRSPERREALGRAARQWVVRHRTWRQNGERYAELYRELAVLPRASTDRRGGGPRLYMPPGASRPALSGRREA